jgi:hypothetical protein
MGVKTADELYSLWFWKQGNIRNDDGSVVKNQKIRNQHIVDGPNMEGDFALEELRSGRVQRLPSGNHWLTEKGKRIGFYYRPQLSNDTIIAELLGERYLYHFANDFTGMRSHFEAILAHFRILN